ncbi:MAG: GNAT family N-acetyltransferase [Verrucomicrobia bacterium]|jgi:GNAT superfamily N-acetyltransferase|nr:GNAT family N-acetyltransferase [Verrucomicrobiota bacterium]
MSELSIRPATERDIPLILRFIRELAEYEKLAQEVAATEALLRAALFGEHPAAEALIGSVDGEPAGYALFFPNFSTFLGRPGLHLEDLYVCPEHRGKGLGLALLRRVAAIAVERDCARLEWSVLDWNEPAIGFYRELGAVPLHDWMVFRLSGEAIRLLAERR